jgi:hypothetical protein
MWRDSFHLIPLFVCFVPLLLVLAMTVLFIVLPILQAPSVATLTRYTRKLLRGWPDASDDELKRILRRRFLPDGAMEREQEVTASEFFLFGLYAYAAPTIRGMRSYFLIEVMDSRINRAIEAADRD